MFFIDLIITGLSLAPQPRVTEKSFALHTVLEQPGIFIDCFSCAIKPLLTNFIKIITEYGALIISV